MSITYTIPTIFEALLTPNNSSGACSKINALQLHVQVRWEILLISEWQRRYPPRAGGRRFFLYFYLTVIQFTISTQSLLSPHNNFCKSPFLVAGIPPRFFKKTIVCSLNQSVNFCDSSFKNLKMLRLK